MIFVQILLYIVFAFCLLAAVLADNTKIFLHRGWVLWCISAIAFGAWMVSL